MKRKLLFLIMFFVGSIIFSSTFSLKNMIKRQMEKQDIPALSILIFDKEDIPYQECFGMANIEKNITLKEDHVFLIASISKVITATALMQLYDKGLFNLDDPINDYLGFKVKNPEYDEEITFRMLLTHTSSIGDGPALDDQYYYGKDSPVSLKKFMMQYFTPGGKYYDDENFYDFEPGMEFEYSNMGSALIAVLVENISGKDFNSYCKKNIFRPLEMTNTYWKLSEIQKSKIVRPYDEYLEPIEHYTFTDYPNGGLRTTAKDLYKLLSTYANDGQYKRYKWLSKRTVEKMLSQQIKRIDSSMGLHFFVMNKKYNLWGHDGGEQGVSTIMAFNPDNGAGVVILTNSGEATLDNIMMEAYKTSIDLAK